MKTIDKFTPVNAGKGRTVKGESQSQVVPGLHELQDLHALMTGDRKTANGKNQ